MQVFNKDPTVLYPRVVLCVLQERNAEGAIEALKEYEPEIAKVMRQNHRGIQRLKARELVPGDIVDVSGKIVVVIMYLSHIKQLTIQNKHTDKQQEGKDGMHKALKN